MNTKPLSVHEVAKHLKILDLKKKRIDRLIGLVHDTLAGTRDCSFDVFSKNEILEEQARFRKEIADKWGETKEYLAFTDLFSEHTKRERVDKWNDLTIQSQDLFKRLSEYVKLSPALPEVQAFVQEWQEYISENFYPCSVEMLSYLGELYVTDERFETFIDRSCTGLAQFFSKAIQFYCADKMT